MNSLPPLSREKSKHLRSLLSRRLRERRGEVLVEGEKNLAEAAGRGFLRYLALREGAGPAKRAGELAERWGVPLFALDLRSWEEVTAVVSSPGLLGVADQPVPPMLDALVATPGPVRLLFLDAVQDPGNAGGLIRSAWALGFHGVLLGAGTADPFGPKAVRASAGGVFHLPLLPDAGEGEARALLATGTTLYLAETGGQRWDKLEWSSRALLAVGNEGIGLSGFLRSLPSQRVSIPMSGGADSLNVLAAGSILMASLARPA